MHGINDDKTMQKLERVIRYQKQQKKELEIMLSNAYGGHERGQEKDTQLTAVMNENRELQRKL